MILGSVIMGLVGLACAVLGLLIWKKEKITLLHDYHYDKVSEENQPAFCRLSGLGVLFIGTGILLSAVTLPITDSLWSFLPFGTGFVLGLGFLLHAGNKYNKA